jgi:hypothetical protein
MMPYIKRAGSTWTVYFPGDQIVSGIRTFKRACKIAKMFGSKWLLQEPVGIPYRELFNR